jgi:hypothetical protein
MPYVEPDSLIPKKEPPGEAESFGKLPSSFPSVSNVPRAEELQPLTSIGLVPSFRRTGPGPVFRDYWGLLRPFWDRSYSAEKR